MRQAFSIILRQNKVGENDWSAVKSAIGQQMATWREKRRIQQIIQEAAFSFKLQELKQLELEEMVREGKMQFSPEGDIVYLEEGENE